MHHNLKIIFLSVFLTIVLFLLFFFKPISSYIYYSMYNKENLVISISVVNSQIHTLSAESSNRVFLKASVKNTDGFPMSNAPLRIFIENGTGELSIKRGSTNSLGECLFSYTPQNHYELQGKTVNPSVKITAMINNSTKSSSKEFKLISTPVVLVYGYQESSEVYYHLSEYLKDKNFHCSTMEYDSKAGVITGAQALEKFLNAKKQEFINKGILVNKFTLITHSMGGLVARCYTSSKAYVKNEDVNKIIFISVPHKGSYFASLGENFYNDASIKDLAPDSHLFANVFEWSINKGLNRSIQIANITSQYDEVVTEESSNLDEWKINTEMFNIGDNNFTVDSILSGDLLNAPNHKGILNNNKVFLRINEMLNTNLSYPSQIQD